MAVQSQPLQTLSKRLFPLPDNCCFINLVSSLHGELPLQRVQHILRGVVSHFGTLHEFLSHLCLDQNIVHPPLHLLQVLAHVGDVWAVLCLLEHFA